MTQHEIKNCPRCASNFECKAGSITQCQCNVVQLTAGETLFIERQYSDCLCLKCLYELKQLSGFKENN